MFTWTIQGMLVLICFPKYWFTCVKRVKRETQHQSILWFCPSYISLTITLHHFCFDLAFYITCLCGIVFGWCWNQACTKTIKHRIIYRELKFVFFNSDTRYFEKLRIKRNSSLVACLANNDWCIKDEISPQAKSLIALYK